MTFTNIRIADGRREIEGDWYAGTIPFGAQIHPASYVGSSQSFSRYRSERSFGAIIGRGASLCDATSLDVGPRGQVRLGEFALVTAARIICDLEIEIGAYALVSWDVVLMDSYRVPDGSPARAHTQPRPIRLGRNSWVGFGACVLPGVSIGEGSIVAARSVVAHDVPDNVIVAGNPARIVRTLR